MTTSAASTQTLYVLICDAGDGSSYLVYTLDSDFIAKLQEAYDEGRMDGEDSVGCDGDGFHYATIHLPAGWTAEDMGIGLMDPEHYAHLFAPK